MAGVEKRDFDSPDESRTPDKTRSDIVHLGGIAAARLTLEPGWSWAECVKPVAGTESCQLPHVALVLQGRLRVRMDDGSEEEFGANHVMLLPPGHDAWSVGDEACVFVEFSRGNDYYD